ncbi:hypothetical protein PV326_014240, partial [Microctonus aethiopoides]
MSDQEDKFDEAVGGDPQLDPKIIIDESILQLPKATSNPPSRASSPTTALTINAEFMIASQQSRLRMLALLNQQASTFDLPETTIGEVQSHIQSLEQEWHRFNIEHEKIGATARRSLLTHPYMTEDTFMQAFNQFTEANARSHRHLERLNRSI